MMHAMSHMECFVDTSWYDARRRVFAGAGKLAPRTKLRRPGHFCEGRKLAGGAWKMQNAGSV
jgi:hypothetical protein